VPGTDRIATLKRAATDQWPDYDWTCATWETGAFHDVLVLAGQVVARITRSSFAAEAMEQRVEVLERLEGRIGQFAVPTVLSKVRRWSPENAGVLCGYVRGSSTERPEDPVAELGRVVDTIHQADPAIFADTEVRSWCGGPDFPGLVSDHVIPLLDDDAATAAADVVHQLLEAEASAPSCVVHGDLNSFNLRWEADVAYGVIDWDFAAVSDPALDIAGILSTLGRDVAAGLTDQDTMRRASKHRATFPLQIACAGLLHDDRRLFDTGIRNFTERHHSGLLHYPGP
jgi:aminoglycoside phosphotransferase (APT) family kinase protein